MANTGNSDKWYFTKEELENTPSRKCGYDQHKELSYRQQAANFIQDMGQRLRVSQLCINTAIVYMHRFYVFHSFTHFPWLQMATAALFLAAKVEEQPRKLEHVIRMANICRNPKDTAFEINSERYIAQSQDLVFNENVLLQTLGFDVAIDHPHTHVVRCCHLVRASKDLAQTSYFMASNSLHLTTMCIQYKPSVVACFCILVACKWSNWEIPLSNEKKEWYSYVDPTVTAELLQELTEEFLTIFDSCPSRLKEKIMAIADVGHTPSPHINSPFDTDPKKVVRDDSKDTHMHRSSHDAKQDEMHKHRSSRPHDPNALSLQQRDREYRDKNRERLAQQQKMMSGGSSKTMHGHHRPPVDPKLKQHARPPGSSGQQPPSNRHAPTSGAAGAHDQQSPFPTPPTKYDQNKAPSGGIRKPTITDSMSLNSYLDARLNFNAERQQRMDSNRARQSTTTVDGASVKAPNKHYPMRRPDGFPAQSGDTNKHSGHEKTASNTAYLSKSSLNSTSQKTKSPPPNAVAVATATTTSSLPAELSSSKSVLKPNLTNARPNQPYQKPPPHHNGSAEARHHHPQVREETAAKDEVVSPPPVVKRPSLFSPEKSPPKKPPPGKVSPPKWLGSEPKTEVESPSRRRRNYSSGSEPELRPVIKKIDQVEGFENLMRDSTIGGMNKFHHKIPDIITPISDMKKEKSALPNYSKEMKPPDIIPPLSCDSNNSISGPPAQTHHHSSAIVNGIETDPTLISNLLKETPVRAGGGLLSMNSEAVSAPTQDSSDTSADVKERDYHHHKSKKKNKEKHKHKDKEKSREEKEKKRKHKDKDREKHKHKDQGVAAASHDTPHITEPIKIKIHKDKIQSLPDNHVSNSIGLKIKIPKDKIKTENIGELHAGNASTAASGVGAVPSVRSIKIKIPKDVITNCNPDGGGAGSLMGGATTTTTTTPVSRKRERNSDGAGGGVNAASWPPPAKMQKASYKESKQNGRHPTYKVAHMGDGDTSLHRLAESKYNNKNSTS